MEKFREIRALAAQREDQEKVDMWEDAGMIRKLAKEIQTLLGTAAGHGQRYPEMQDRGLGWVGMLIFVKPRRPSEPHRRRFVFKLASHREFQGAGTYVSP